MTALQPEQIFAGRYQLMQLLGKGGFGEVWKASDQMAEEAVAALKIYAPGQGLDPAGLKLFRREYAITKPLRHPNLLKAEYFDVFEGMPYLILPFCEQGSLGTKLLEEDTLSEPEIWKVIAQVGDALAYLHSKGVLHQDIKPDNILIDEEGNYLLADFGISYRLQSTIRKSTGARESLTVAYAPPERFTAQPQNTEASDVFSLGVSLYELASGDVPWAGQGGLALVNGAAIPQLPNEFSGELNQVVSQCMSKEPNKRYDPASMATFARKYQENDDGKYQGSGRETVPVDAHRKRENSGYNDGISGKDTTTIYAGFWLRAVALIIDTIIISIGAGIIGFIVGIYWGIAGVSEDAIVAFIYLISIVGNWLYYAGMESSAKQATFGKQALEIKVTDESGDRVSFGRTTGRYFGKIISALLLLIGYLMAAFTEKKQALHDIMANTYVIKK